MKIATLNIDWAKKYRSEKHFIEIEKYLNQQDFDFLILTEAIDLNLENFEFKYFSEPIPENVIYEKLNYTTYLKGEKAFRSVIYSKIPCKKKFKVNDDKTSLALEFETEFGDIAIYATIIGTLFRQQPFANKELENCISDCEAISKVNPNLIIVGDLNTSFLDTDKDFTINVEITKTLNGFFEKLSLINLTEKISQNIDHIIISKNFKLNSFESKVFVEKGKLSDHAGVFVTLNA